MKGDVSWYSLQLSQSKQLLLRALQDFFHLEQVEHSLAYLESVCTGQIQSDSRPS